ncbi:hypothetical protein [Clostridium sp. Marseille-QA1073]
MNTIKDIKLYSINGDNGFMWVAEFTNGRLINELENNSFDIDRKRLLNFGIVGCGVNLHYQIPTGIFDLNGRIVEFFLVDDEGKEYELTNTFNLYNDCICYHNYYADINTEDSSSHLCGYSFGYKTKLDLMDLKLNFQPLLSVNHDDVPVFKFKLVSNKDIDNGKLLIKVDRKYIKSIPIKLVNNIRAEVQYKLK